MSPCWFVGSEEEVCVEHPKACSLAEKGVIKSKSEERLSSASFPCWCRVEGHQLKSVEKGWLAGPWLLLSSSTNR